MYYIRICFGVEWKHPEIRLPNLPKMAAHSSPHEDVLSVATPEGYQEVGKVYLRRINSYKLTGPKHNLHQGSFSRSMSHEHSHHSIVSLVFFLFQDLRYLSIRPNDDVHPTGCANSWKAA